MTSQTIKNIAAQKPRIHAVGLIFGSSSSGSSKPSDASGYKGLPSVMADLTSLYYSSLRYAIRNGVLSSFFLWSWLFRDRDAYEEEYRTGKLRRGRLVVAGTGIVPVGLPI